MSMQHLSRPFNIIAALTLGTFLIPSPAVGQSVAPSTPRFSLEVNGGAALFGRFLEQRLESGERELTAEAAPNVGFALGFQAWEKAGVRISGSFVPAQLEFRTDIGNGSAGLNAKDVGDINVWTFGAEVVRFVSLRVGPFTPYASAGIVGSVWSLDSEGLASDVIEPENDSQLRLGFITRTGLQLNATSHLAIRLEIGALSTSSPFDGQDSFRLVDGETVFDEAESSSIRQLNLGLVYAF